MFKYVIYYLLFLNLLGFFFMHLDKERAKSGKWRIKESTLITIALLGGSIGSLLGMKVFRHKTKHNKFKYGIPFIIIVQVLIYIYIK